MLLKTWSRALLFIIIANSAFSSEILDKKMAQISSLESVFILESSVQSIVTITNPIPWQDSGLRVKVSNQWKLSVVSKKLIQITKLSLNINGVNIVVPINLAASANTPVEYFISSPDFTKHISAIGGKKKFLRVFSNLNADSLLDYPKGNYQLIRLTITYLSDKQNYNETTKNLIMVFV